MYQIRIKREFWALQADVPTFKRADCTFFLFFLDINRQNKRRSNIFFRLPKQLLR